LVKNDRYLVPGLDVANIVCNGLSCIVKKPNGINVSEYKIYSNDKEIASSTGPNDINVVFNTEGSNLVKDKVVVNGKESDATPEYTIVIYNKPSLSLVVCYNTQFTLEISNKKIMILVTFGLISKMVQLRFNLHL